MATTGHEQEAINVEGLKAALQELKTDILDGKAEKSEMSVTAGTGTDADKTTIQLKSGTSATVLTTHQTKTDLGLNNVTNDAQVKRTEMGANSGVATLDSTGKITSTQLPDYVTNIDGIVPTQATSSNQLADKSFVNSSISTATATFRGTSATGLTEQQFLAWANALTKDDNDYVFWNTVDSDGNTQFKRYKYDGAQWSYEYTLNNSSFTSVQWAAIESGITSNLVDKLTELPTNASLTTSLGNKADKVSSATNGNFAGLDSEGNLIDSGSKVADFATAEQFALADRLDNYIDLGASQENPVNLDDITTPGVYYSSASGVAYITNLPLFSNGDVQSFKLTVEKGVGNTVIQTIEERTGRRRVFRRAVGNAWDLISHRNVLASDELYKTTTHISTIGWYRIGHSYFYESAEVLVGSTHEQGQSNVIQFQIFRKKNGTCYITQLGGYADFSEITKVRVVHTTDISVNTYYYIEVYYATTNSNNIFWKFYNGHPYTTIEAGSIPEGYTSTEFTFGNVSSGKMLTSDDMATTAVTSVDTTDSIMLKDTNGSYQAIERDSFMGAVRDCLYSVLSSQGTSSGGVLTYQSGIVGRTTNANVGTILSGLTSGSRLCACVQGPLSSTANQSVTGWLRAAHLTMPGYGGSGQRTTCGFGLYLIVVSSCYWGAEPTPALFLLSANDYHHSLTQLGKIPATSYTQCLQKVRVVQNARYSLYFDINVRTMASNNKGSRYFTTIYPLSGLPSDIETIAYTDVTSEDVGTNVTTITLTP